jgi:hypothetical protein
MNWRLVEDFGMPGRFESQFDPDELNKITHRGLQSLSRSQFDENRQTSEHLTNLKARQTKEDTIVVKITRFFARILDGIAGMFRAMLTPPKKKVVQCEQYGHVLKPGWTGAHPKCEDCGAPILSLDDVRKAMPKDQNKGQQPEQQQRKYVK